MPELRRGLTQNKKTMAGLILQWDMEVDMYTVQNPMEKAMGGMNNAAGTYGSMMKNIPANGDPGPSVGGAINAGVGGAVAGAALAGTETGAAALGAIGMTGGMAIPVVAALGIGAYLLS